MELITQLQELKSKDLLNKEEILKLTSIEDLFFIIMEAKQTNTPDYNNLYSFFEEVREIMFDNGGINIFEEFLTIKYFYLQSVYNVDGVVLESLMNLLGPVLLDYELETRFLKEDNMYNFYITRYSQFKQNNELTVLKMLNRIDFAQIKMEGEELQKVLEDLKETAGLK